MQDTINSNGYFHIRCTWQIEFNSSKVDLNYFSAKTDLGEIYSMALDDNTLLTSHSRAGVATLHVWTLGPNLTIQDSDAESNLLVPNEEGSVSESIIWSITLDFPLAFLCHDNESLDVFDLRENKRLKRLRHGQAKVLSAQVRGGIVVVGCQYGNVVLWKLEVTFCKPRSRAHI